MIYDKALKRELIDGPANKFLYTRNNHKTWESDPEAALGAKVTRRVYLPYDEKRIDIEDTFEHARDLFNTCRYYRYGYLAFPFAVPKEFRSDGKPHELLDCVGKVAYRDPSRPAAFQLLHGVDAPTTAWMNATAMDGGVGDCLGRIS